MGVVRNLLRRLGLGGGQGSPRSKRLIFAYDATGVHLTRETTREKPAPRGDELSRPPPPDHLWVEVRDPDGAVVYRRTLVNAIPQDTEVFEPDGRIRSVPHTPDTGVFTVVVPFDTRTVEAVVVAGPEAELAQPGLRMAEAPEGQARELARASLRRG
jgi:hypothetical protein